MLNPEDIAKLKQASQLELEGLKKLAEAQELLKGGAMKVEGDPAPVSPEGEGMVLMLSDESKTASLEILNKIAKELEESEDEELKAQAGEVRLAADAVEKNSFVYERDTVLPEPEIAEFFKGGVIEAPSEGKSSPAIKKFETDDTVEVANFAKNPAPYQKV